MPVTNTENSLSLKGEEPLISGILVDGVTLDFTSYVNSLSDITSGTPYTLTLQGYSSESQAFLPNYEDVSYRWASSEVEQVVTYSNLQGETVTASVPNKEEPTQSLKDTGLLFEESAPRVYINYMFDEIGKALTDLADRVKALE